MTKKNSSECFICRWGAEITLEGTYILSISKSDKTIGSWVLETTLTEYELKSYIKCGSLDLLIFSPNWMFTVNFLNIRTPKIFVVITLKFELCGSIIE